jgi:8-oxo-dGTP pyrophosphatase MutT (NUDIX family)
MASISTTTRELWRAVQAPARVDRARCVLVHDRRILLARHRSRRVANRSKWGLPGGRLKASESPEAGLRRELVEELGVEVPYLVEIGDWAHREENHRVFGCEIEEPILAFGTDELLAIQWFSVSEVRALEGARLLRLGFELAAVTAFRRLLPEGDLGGPRSTI